MDEIFMNNKIQSKHNTINLCWFIVNNLTYEMFKLHFYKYFKFH